jgi:hypothetical protein
MDYPPEGPVPAASGPGGIKNTPRAIKILFILTGAKDIGFGRFFGRAAPSA